MYNNPNFYGMNPMYYSNMPRRASLFSKLKNGVNWGNLLNNTSKTLNVINQAIPIFYQVKPLFQNAKTMFKIADIIRSDNNGSGKQIHKNEEKSPTSRQNNTNSLKKEEPYRSSNQPTFFL